MDYNQRCLACYCDQLRTFLPFLSLCCGPWGPLIMTSVWSLLWAVCGLTVWFPHTHAASVSPTLLMSTSDPVTDERSVNPEHQTEAADPASNYTASVSPNLPMNTSDPAMDEQSVNPEHQTEAADPASNYTASMSPNQFMNTSDLEPDEQSVNPEQQTEAADPANKYTASMSPSLLMTTSDPGSDEHTINQFHHTEPADPPSINTASMSPILLMPTSDPTDDQQSINPEPQTEPTDLLISHDTASVSSILLMTTSEASTTSDTSTTPKLKGFTDPPRNNNTGLVCISVLPPRRGSYYVEHGTGVSVGSMLVFWCKEGYQLVGHEKITCILHAGVPRWSNYLPVCESIPRPNDQGLRIALLVSVVSGVVILVMTVCFIVCCCQEHISKKKEKHRTGRSRRREMRTSRSRRSPSWLEREHLDWEAFPPPKLFSLSQRLDRPLPPGSPVYSEVIRSYENRGYERSQESLLRSPNTSYPTYPANSQIYPALVFQRVQTEPNPSSSSTNPVYVQIATPPKNKTHHASVTHP